MRTLFLVIAVFCLTAPRITFAPDQPDPIREAREFRKAAVFLLVFLSDRFPGMGMAGILEWAKATPRGALANAATSLKNYRLQGNEIAVLGDWVFGKELTDRLLLAFSPDLYDPVLFLQAFDARIDWTGIEDLRMGAPWIILDGLRMERSRLQRDLTAAETLAVIESTIPGVGLRENALPRTRVAFLGSNLALRNLARDSLVIPNVSEVARKLLDDVRYDEGQGHCPSWISDVGD